MRNIFTSDHHFDHVKVIEYSKRPFSSVDEMNEVMVERWNAVVEAEDTVWYEGDFSLNKKALRFVPRLNGKKILIPGNHDSCFPGHKKHKKEIQRYLDAGFQEVILKPYLFQGKFTALLWHLPYIPETPPVGYDLRYPDWRPKDQGSILLHGHVHEYWLKRGRMINVGVDQHDFYPVTEDRILEILSLQAVNL